jgi:hypothetical protein
VRASPFNQKTIADFQAKKGRPSYADYQRRTTRLIPVIVLERQP